MAAAATRSINTIDGKYRVLAQLGQGGTADVNLAVARGPGGFSKLVVLKSMRSQFRDEPEFAEMFMNEARLAAQLNHPNIVQTNEVFDFEGLPVIVMEYLEGQPLSTVIAKTRGTARFPEAMHLRVLSDCLAALEYAHNLEDFEGNELGVVHRDVSPHNVFVTYDGQVKLLDFGIAKLNTSHVETATGVIKGKLRYMPPEQITGDGVDRRSDLFAVGVMLWEAATGQKMWGNASEANIMNAVLNGEIPTPSSVHPDVAPELEQIILRALEVEKDARYSTAAEMQAALDEYLANTGSVVRSRDIGVVMSELFAESREQTRAIVQQQLAHVAALTEADVRKFQPIELTATSSQTAFDSSSTHVVGQKPHSWRSVALILALGGLVGAAGLALWSKSHGGEEPRERAAAARVEPTVPEEVYLRITAFPATAQLELDGELLPSNPFTRTYPYEPERLRELKVTAPGHEPAIRQIKLDQNTDLVLTLTELPQPAASTPPEAEPSRPKLPTPAVRPAPRPAPKPAVPAKPKTNCDPPYYVDARGVKKFKPGCL